MFKKNEILQNNFNYEEINKKGIIPWKLKRKNDLWLLYVTDKKLIFIPKYGNGGNYKIITLCIMDVLNIELHYSMFKNIPEIKFEIAHKDRVKYSTFFTREYGSLVKEISDKKYSYYMNQIRGIDRKYNVLKKVLKENAGFISSGNWNKLHDNGLCFQISKRCPLCME